MTIRVLVWNENVHETKQPEIAAIYPDGIHGAIAEGLNAVDGIEAGTATLDEPEHGLTQDVVDNTDVFVWWGHMAHDDVEDRIVEKVQKRVLAGLDRLLETHRGRTVVLVSHVTPIKTLVAHAMDAPLESLFRMELSPAAVSVVSFYDDPSGAPRGSLRFFNALAPGRRTLRDTGRW